MSLRAAFAVFIAGHSPSPTPSPTDTVPRAVSVLAGASELTSECSCPRHRECSCPRHRECSCVVTYGNYNPHTPPPISTPPFSPSPSLLPRPPKETGLLMSAEQQFSLSQPISWISSCISDLICACCASDLMCASTSRICNNSSFIIPLFSPINPTGDTPPPPLPLLEGEVCSPDAVSVVVFCDRRECYPILVAQTQIQPEVGGKV